MKILQKVLFFRYNSVIKFRTQKIVALSNKGYVYMWGMEGYNSDYEDCNVTWESRAMNLCAPLKLIPENSNLTTEKSFKSIQGGLDAIVGKRWKW